MIKNKDILKPCPFCGEEDVDTWEWRGHFAMECPRNKCGASGPSRDNERDAEIAWNTRS